MCCLYKSEKRTPFIDLIWHIVILLGIWCVFHYVSFYTNALSKKLMYSSNLYLKLSVPLIYAIPSVNVTVWSLAIPMVYLKYVVKPLGSVMVNNCKFSIRMLFTSTFITIVLFLLYMLFIWSSVNIYSLYKYFDFIPTYVVQMESFKSSFLSAEVHNSSYSSFSHFFWNGIIIPKYVLTLH